MNEEKTDDKLSHYEKGSKSFHCRDILQKFVNSPPPKIRSISFIEIEDKDGNVTRTGDLAFTISLSDMGVDRETYLRCPNEFFSNFMADTFGEFLVRENIKMFIKLISSMKTEDYIQSVSSKTHKRFGMNLEYQTLTFKFHISLFQNIITEDLKNL